VKEIARLICLLDGANEKEILEHEVAEHGSKPSPEMHRQLMSPFLRVIIAPH